MQEVFCGWAKSVRFPRCGGVGTRHHLAPHHTAKPHYRRLTTTKPAASPPSTPSQRPSHTHAGGPSSPPLIRMLVAVLAHRRRVAGPPSSSCQRDRQGAGGRVPGEDLTASWEPRQIRDKSARDDRAGCAMVRRSVRIDEAQGRRESREVTGCQAVGGGCAAEVTGPPASLESRAGGLGPQVFTMVIGSKNQGSAF